MSRTHPILSPMDGAGGAATAQVTTEAPARRARKVLAGERLDVLDGMRGIAALMVVVYHFFARWAEPVHEPTLYPHGNTLAEMPFLIVFGDVGILLFFLVSGFVIMMTLERSTGILDFVGRRIARLWPAMIVCATLSAIVINLSDIAGYYEGKEWWAVRPFEYVSSLFFLPPDLTGSIFGIEGGRLDWVEGVYWTLWHEVRFYALISLVFLISPRLWFLWVWAAIQGISTAIDLGMMAIDQNYLVGMGVELLFQPRMLAWFSLGLCGYMVWSKRTDKPIAVIAVLAVIAILSREVFHMPEGRIVPVPQVGKELITYGLVVAPFLLFLARSPVLNVLRLPGIVTIGLASYPLYLFHELPGMAGMKIGAEMGAPPMLTALVTMALVIVAAIAIHHLVENPGKRVITRHWRRMFGDLEKNKTWLRY
jgi:peptidoglycan/LPS O-acetylase OafA/YrhL